MQAPPPERTVPFNLDLVFRRGMGRRLLLCILALAIPPLVLVGWINYQTATSHMEQEIQKTIQVNAELKSQQIGAYIQGRLADAERQGHQPATISFFNALVRRHSATEETLSEFILSTQWNTAVLAYGSGIQLHAELHGYHDILMIDPDGNVIFSSAKTNDLAGNLNQADMATTGIGTAFRETLETGKPVFSGFETGVPDGNGVRAFITAAIGDVGDSPAGVIAFKIPGSDIQQIIDMPPEPGESVRIYLLDADLTLLAGTIEGQRPDTRLTVKTAVAQQWRAALAKDRSALPQSSLLDYKDPGGHRIVGTYAPIQPGNAPYALVVEIDRTMALTTIHRQQMILFTIVILTGLAVIAVSTALARMLVEPLRDLTEGVSRASHGQFNDDMEAYSSHELGQLEMACHILIDRIRTLTTEHETQSRFIAGVASLQRLIGGAQEPGELCLNTLEFLSDFLDLHQADFYIKDESGRLQCACHFPGQPICKPDMIFFPGEGRVGQAVLEKTLLAFRRDAADDLIIAVPTVEVGNLVAIPLMLEETVIGGLEIEKTSVFSLFDGHYLTAAAEFIAMALSAALTREKEITLLEKTREQAEKLKLRETALESKTHELKTQSQAFQQSEQVLQLKHLELEAANAQMVKNAADLEANMAILEQQQRDMQRQNAELEQAHRQLAEKARQLEISSRYKTEFMANMSHELRTPLNSILLLSRLLVENKEHTLTARQAEFAQTVYSAGEDLLNLINEILDLAKVESGKMELESAPVEIQSIARAMQGSFTPLAEQGGITFTAHVAPDVPAQLISDRKRIEQIVKNFLSNAFKFTPSGSIGLEFTTSRKPVTSGHTSDNDGMDWLSISVVDTGIGIPAAKQQMVFDAFQQVDGSTRRKYGGTGLGLSISRELARMLGGEITLESEEGRGSRFTLHLPILVPSIEEPSIMREPALIASSETPPPMRPSVEEAAPQTAGGLVPDDRHRLVPGNPCMLIIDADTQTIETIMASAHDHGFKVLVAEQVMTGLHFADYYLPIAVFINPHLSEPNTWSIVHRIKSNPKTRHIPVFTISSQDERVEAAVHGAAGHILLPPAKNRLALAFRQIETWRSKGDRTVLVVASDAQQTATRINTAIGIGTIQFLPAATADAAREALDTQTVDTVILHPAMDAAAQQQFLTIWQAHPVPLVIYDEAPSTPDGPTGIKQVAQIANLKRINSPNRLLTALVACLHLSPDTLDVFHRNRLGASNNHQAALYGRRVLLVDDDMRTVFAVTSALEDQGVEVCTGKTGKESLDKLSSFPDIDLILMDVMIAEVDGYQAIREIRNRDRFENIPILALTAKAMQGDRAKCIDAGADDYLAKPVNLDKLTSMLSIWLDPALTKPQRIHA